MAMQWSDISFRPPVRTLRQFAGFWLLAFGGLCLQAALRQQTMLAWVFGSVALVVALPGLVRPAAIRPVFGTAMLVTFPMGWVLSRLVLAMVYFGVFTPVAICLRLLDRDVLCRHRPPAVDTFWSPRSVATDPRQYLRPF
jgi:hypothetical protein